MDDIFYHEEYKMWWPKFDHNPEGNKHTIENGIGAIEVLRKHCKSFNTCVQAGGHLGYWPIELSKHFHDVFTFEADPIVFECLRRNIQESRRDAPTAMHLFIHTIGMALGIECKKVKLRRGSSAGGSRINESGKIEVLQTTIDGFNIGRCDAIILDIEGGEINALKGAEETIKRYSPVILVEELPEFKEELYYHMASIGYVRVDEYARDGIWVRK